MTLRVALRSLASRPVRNAVLSCGFGFGISVMAALLGVGEVILEQARAVPLRGRGDVVIAGAAGEVGSARFLKSSVLASPPFAGRVAAVSPMKEAILYLVRSGAIVPVVARGGIPSLERALRDPETGGIATWSDAPADEVWSSPEPSDVLRAMDRFHPIPDAAAAAASWAEWLYFNGRNRDGATRFYLTFLAGPRSRPGWRGAIVRLQLERAGKVANYSTWAEVPEETLLENAPDVDIGACRVRLEALRYRIDLALDAEPEHTASGARGRFGATELGMMTSAGGAPDLTGEITLEVAPGRSIPPFSIRGARGWISGYVIPVLAGAVKGSLRIGRETIGFEDAIGYHDHNWGFWEGVSWQWGQVAHDDLSFVYGRVRPPADAADPERIPGFVGVLGPDGPLGFSTNVTIEETDEPANASGEGAPRRISVRAKSVDLDLRMELSVQEAISTPLTGPFAPTARSAMNFLQMRALYRVDGRAGGRSIDFTAQGAAETFRAAR